VVGDPSLSYVVCDESALGRESSARCDVTRQCCNLGKFRTQHCDKESLPERRELDSVGWSWVLPAIDTECPLGYTRFKPGIGSS
jgi:hypothetical protein